MSKKKVVKEWEWIYLVVIYLIYGLLMIKYYCPRSCSLKTLQSWSLVLNQRKTDYLGTNTKIEDDIKVEEMDI